MVHTVDTNVAAVSQRMLTS